MPWQSVVVTKIDSMKRGMSSPHGSVFLVFNGDYRSRVMPRLASFGRHCQGK